MQHIQFLEKLGLTSTEIEVYLDALSRTHTSVKEISDSTDLKRPRIYHALETLEEKGLVRRIGKGNVKRYSAESPTQLSMLLKRKELKISTLGKELEQVLPLFLRQTERVTHEFGVEYFSGKEGIFNMAERVFSAKTKKMYAINPSFETMEPLLDEAYGMFYVNKRSDANIETKTIWQDLPSKKYSLALQDHTVLKREMRIAPVETFGEFKSTIMIFDNSVAVINYLPEVSGVLITSFSYAETMRLMWQQIWDKADSVD